MVERGRCMMWVMLDVMIALRGEASCIDIMESRPDKKSVSLYVGIAARFQSLVRPVVSVLSSYCRCVSNACSVASRG